MEKTKLAIPMIDIMEGCQAWTTKIGEEGFISLVDVSPRLVPEGRGVDFAVVRSARTSYGLGLKSIEEDDKLIRYLMEHHHTSPFEFVECTWHVNLPIFVARQWMRHRTGSFNEVSGRYAKLPQQYYIPEHVHVQSSTNKQGSDGRVSAELESKMRVDLNANSAVCFTFYDEMINDGVSKEEARLFLPLNTFTQFYWKTDLHNTLHFLKLRLHPAAQFEIRQYAQAICDILQKLCPTTMQAFSDYILNAVTFNAREVAVLTGKLSDLDLTPREKRELIRKQTALSIKAQEVNA